MGDKKLAAITKKEARTILGDVNIEDDELESVSKKALEIKGDIVKGPISIGFVFSKNNTTDWFYDIVCWAKAKKLTFVK
jgi:hypothetical protein